MTAHAHIRHIRKAKICLSGARDWFAKHELSWNDFPENGCPPETLEATGDPMAIQVAKFARDEVDNV